MWSQTFGPHYMKYYQMTEKCIVFSPQLYCPALFYIWIYYSWKLQSSAFFIWFLCCHIRRILGDGFYIFLQPDVRLHAGLAVWKVCCWVSCPFLNSKRNKNGFEYHNNHLILLWTLNTSNTGWSTKRLPMNFPTDPITFWNGLFGHRINVEQEHTININNHCGRQSPSCCSFIVPHTIKIV